MKTSSKTATLKNIDLLISKISSKDVLNINEMICIRGGDGGNDNFPIPPVPPTEGN